MDSYKIKYKLYIKPLNTHFGKPINECACGECPGLIVREDSFIINCDEKYYCRVIKKVIKVFDAETASDCFQAWFTEGEGDEKEKGAVISLIPKKQKEFYKSDFLNIEENEFQGGFEDLELEINDVEQMSKG